MKAPGGILASEQVTKMLSLDPDAIREDFPILEQMVYGKPLVYLDNAATSQKPRVVIDELTQYYSTDNSNIHRGVHLLSERATASYEAARVKAQRFINAAESKEVIFTRGTTEAINLVANSYGRANVKAGDEVLITAMEHHSNIVPWQILCDEKGARLRVAPINDEGELILEELAALINRKTKIISLVHVSNALGTINPIRAVVEIAHRHEVPVMIDGAQAAPHIRLDVQELDCDFYAFSGHKVYGPTGIGVLYGKAELLDAMPPYQGGGDMIASVAFDKTTYNTLPYKFEAGTPNIAGVVGLGAALRYVESLDRAGAQAHEDTLLAEATARVRGIQGVRILAETAQRSSVLSFVVDGVHPHDIGTILDAEGIAVRTGQHCAQPVMDRYGVPATVRASIGLYNTGDEIAQLVAGLHKVREVFG